MSDKAMLVTYLSLLGALVLYVAGCFIWSRWPAPNTSEVDCRRRTDNYRATFTSMKPAKLSFGDLRRHLRAANIAWKLHEGAPPENFQQWRSNPDNEQALLKAQAVLAAGLRLRQVS